VVLALVLSAAVLGIGGLPSTLGSPLAAAPLFTVKPLTLVPDHPFAAGCEVTAQTGTNFPNAEVEPYIAISTKNPSNIIGVFQQDRWSNGGAHGLVTAFSTNGGSTWAVSSRLPPFSRCAGGTPSNGGDFERASDPWVSITPGGPAFQVAISFNDSNPVNAVQVSRSMTLGATWENPVTLKLDTLATEFNDKESVTADTVVAGNVYVVWDRLVSPVAQASAEAFEHSVAFRGPTWFARSTNGGDSWEPARMIFDPGEIDQTIGNEIVVLPDGTLIDGFDLLLKHMNPHRGAIVGCPPANTCEVALIRSSDHGDTWSSPIVVSELRSVGVRIPFLGSPVRTGDIIPQFAVDPASGILYAVWQDGRFSNSAHDDIAFSLSTDGGATWTAPVKINKTLNNMPAFTASVAVASDGTVAVTYYDFRNATASAPGTTDYWIIHCNAGLGCADPSLWSESHVGGPFNMLNAPVARGFFVGDYEGLASSGTIFHPFFVQTNASSTNRTDVFTTTAGSGL
jgi:hypothetical protein